MKIKHRGFKSEKVTSENIKFWDWLFDEAIRSRNLEKNLQKLSTRDYYGSYKHFDDHSFPEAGETTYANKASI
ncbi:hypothetical protein ACFL2C_01315 [Patescibacteria group bacterium]